MKTREDVIAEYQAALDALPDENKDKVIFGCACGEHELSPRSALEAMKDPNNEDGQELIALAIQLSSELESS
jgi:hypothetical protein